MTFIHPLVLTLVWVPSTSIKLISRQYSLLFLKLLARALLCLPHEVFPPDRFLHLDLSLSLPPPLDAARCAPPVDEEG